MSGTDVAWRQWPALDGIGALQRWRIGYRTSPLVEDPLKTMLDPLQAPEPEIDAETLYWVRGLGLEDGHRRGNLWLARGVGHLAITLGGDGSQGPGSVRQWTNPRGLPAALGALCILPRPPAAASRHIHVEATAVATAIEAGCRALSERLDLETLTGIFAALIDGCRGIVLPDADAPWPGEALAALLLPFERGFADALSIAAIPMPPGSVEIGGILWCDQHRVGIPQPSPSGTHSLALAKRMAKALLSNRPGLLDEPQAPANDDPAALTFRIWGATSSGKTAYLAQLYASLDHGGDLLWKVRVPPGAKRSWLDDQLSTIQRYNRFPGATGAGQCDELFYRLRNEQTDDEIILAIEDRPGEDYRILAPEIAQRLASADALLLLLDPRRDPSSQAEEVGRAFLAIQQERKDKDRDPRPLAVCISKIDEQIRDLNDLQRMLAQPDKLLDELIGPYVAQAVRHYWEQYRVFPLSAAGLRITYGAVAPSSFYDESLSLRINPAAKPVNLLEPLLWAYQVLRR